MTRDRAQPKVAGSFTRLLVLMALVAALLASVPGLRPVLSTIRHISPVWIVSGVALELASCVSFVILFPLFFDRFRPRDARALAWTEMATGALLPGGGAGGLAIGGWLMHLLGAPSEWIIRRSGGLFFLTSAVNGSSLIIAGVLLGTGIGSPNGFTLTLLPALLALAAIVPVAALPRIMRSHRHAPPWIHGITAGVRDAEETTFEHPNWRLAGALGYLGFDMAVLWITLKGVGEPIPVPALVLAYNIGYLANALPIPGGIGVLDAGLAGSLLLYGAPASRVTAAVLVYHAIALWVPGLGGTLEYFRLRRRRMTPLPAPVSVGRAAAPITVGPAAAPITVSPAAAPITVSPAAAPVTVGRAAEPVTVRPTAAPDTVRPTAVPVASPSSLPPLRSRYMCPELPERSGAPRRSPG